MSANPIICCYYGPLEPGSQGGYSTGCCQSGTNCCSWCMGSFSKYKKTTSQVLGILQIILGCLILISWVGMLVATVTLDSIYYSEVYYVGHGAWCGIFLIITGSFGVVAGKKRRWAVVTVLVMAILAALVTLGAATVSVAGLIEDTHHLRNLNRDERRVRGKIENPERSYRDNIYACENQRWNSDYSYDSVNIDYRLCLKNIHDFMMPAQVTYIAINGTILLLSLISFGLSVAASVHCCKGMVSPQSPEYTPLGQMEYQANAQVVTYHDVPSMMTDAKDHTTGPHSTSNPAPPAQDALQQDLLDMVQQTIDGEQGDDNDDKLLLTE